MRETQVAGTGVIEMAEEKKPPTRLFLSCPYSAEFDVERPDRGNLEIYRCIRASLRDRLSPTSKVLLTPLSTANPLVCLEINIA